jgi:hypothetical protein
MTVCESCCVARARRPSLALHIFLPPYRLRGSARRCNRLGTQAAFELAQALHDLPQLQTLNLEYELAAVRPACGVQCWGVARTHCSRGGAHVLEGWCFHETCQSFRPIESEWLSD